MKKLASILIAGSALIGVAQAEAEKAVKPIGFSFNGPMGTFDRGALQRGYKVYKEVCANCHAMKYIAFRNLEGSSGLGYNEEQVKALAASFKIHDTKDTGEGFDRPGLPSDYFPSPFATPAAATAALGAAPPDLSLIVKARDGGAAYVYSVLTGFETPSAEAVKNAPQGKYFNPYAETGPWISMQPPLSDGLVSYDDGAPNKVADMSRDVATFLAWASDPKAEERKQTGFQVMIYLLVLAGLLYALKRKVWADVH